MHYKWYAKLFLKFPATSTCRICVGAMERGPPRSEVALTQRWRTFFSSVLTLIEPEIVRCVPCEQFSVSFYVWVNQPGMTAFYTWCSVTPPALSLSWITLRAEVITSLSFGKKISWSKNLQGSRFCFVLFWKNTITLLCHRRFLNTCAFSNLWPIVLLSKIVKNRVFKYEAI